MMDLKHILTRIKSKKELAGISDKVVLSLIDKYFPASSKKSLSSKDEKELVSLIRADLRKISGRFQSPSLKNLAVVERKEAYSLLKRLFVSLKIKSVLDLGCGVNPVKLAQSTMKYYAYDINEENLAAVRKYFQENNIDGNTKAYDLVNDDQPFPKTDITLFMKLFDVLETKGHKLAEKLILRANSEYLLVSFPTKTLSGAPMRHPQRGWIELLFDRLGFSFISLSGKNEIFYLAAKSNLQKYLLQLKQEMQSEPL